MERGIRQAGGICRRIAPRSWPLRQFRRDHVGVLDVRRLGEQFVRLVHQGRCDGPGEMRLAAGVFGVQVDDRIRRLAELDGERIVRDGDEDLVRIAPGPPGIVDEIRATLRALQRLQGVQGEGFADAVLRGLGQVVFQNRLSRY